MELNRKVALAVSGGVDSAVSAYKLKELGYQVIGVHFQFWKWENRLGVTSSQYISLLDEIRQKIKIEIRVLEFEKLFKETIVDKFLSDLSNGQTPNPCVRCNPLIKFNLLREFADKERIEYISTGHYARVEKTKEGDFRLLKGVDPKKDQSYVLCYLTQALLSRTIFPLGETYKIDNLETAAQIRLKSVQIGESQDLCFVKPKHYQKFLRDSFPEALISGDIIDKAGNKLGIHSGLPLYTIGQRKGIKVSSEKPYYVISKDLISNKLVVGHFDDLGNDRFIVDNVNWIRALKNYSFSCDVKIRYRSRRTKCLVEKKGSDLYEVTLSQGLRDITPGQFAVFYIGDEVLGGGVIKGIL